MSGRIAIVARPSPGARCAFCHDGLELEVFVCPGCRTSLHADCADNIAECPTLGCHRSLFTLRPPGERRPRPTRTAFRRALANLSTWHDTRERRAAEDLARTLAEARASAQAALGVAPSPADAQQPNTPSTSTGSLGSGGASAPGEVSPSVAATRESTAPAVATGSPARLTAVTTTSGPLASVATWAAGAAFFLLALGALLALVSHLDPLDGAGRARLLEASLWLGAGGVLGAFVSLGLLARERRRELAAARQGSP